MSGGGVRVSIPSSLRKTIQNIKEITGNHSEEEIYAMLKDCSMDPNETTQKLLLLDTFHEVKRKRDKRKESTNNRESGDSRWRPGMQGRGTRGGRTNFSSRYTAHDAGSGRNPGPGKENGTNQAMEKGVVPSLPASQEKTKETIPSASSATIVVNGPLGIASGSASEVPGSSLPAGPGVSHHEVISVSVAINKLGSAVSPKDADKTPTIAFGTGDSHGEPIPSSSSSSVSVTPAYSTTVCFLSSDPVLVLSDDSRLPGAEGTIKREVGGHRPVGETNAVIAAKKSASEIGSSFLQGNMPGKSLGMGKSQLGEFSQHSSVLNLGGSSSSRPSSNYSSRSQVIGPQKAGSNKEWKPKPVNTNVPQGSGNGSSSDIANSLVEASAQSEPETSVLDSKEATAQLQMKLEGLHLPQRQHVIIPNHIHVPESERTKLSFGSFDASFGVTSTYITGLECDNSFTPVSETSQVIEETMEDQAASNQNTLLSGEEGTYPNHLRKPSDMPGILSTEGDVSSSAVPEYNESKQENALLSGGHQYSVVHTSPNYSFGFVPSMLGSQIPLFENSEPQTCDVSRLPSFVGGNSLVLSSAGPTPLVTQAAGLMQSSIAVTQQPVSVFRPPTGLHISHYPPNYIPYGHYFSPFYVAPPGIHQFLSNGAFPQQPQAGSVYPAPPAAAAAAATGVKYSLLQYKPGNSTGNSTHIGMPGVYGPYGSSPAGYNPISSASGGNSTANEDLGASQFKDSSVYMSEQQSEGSSVWIAAPGRDISSLPASSFYNLPPQGQHVTFAPTQAGHGTFAGIYHPGQAVTAAAVHPLLQQSQAMAGAVDMVGPAASVYQQPQHQQINWPRNY